MNLISGAKVLWKPFNFTGSNKMNNVYKNGKAGELDPGFLPIAIPDPHPQPATEFLLPDILVPLPDGGFIIGCQHYIESYNQPPTLVRITPDYKLDTGFGKEGYAYVSLRSAEPQALNDGAMLSLDLLPDGKILVRLETTINDNGQTIYCPVLARFNSDGTKDSTFAQDGVRLYPLPPPVPGGVVPPDEPVSTASSLRPAIQARLAFGDIKVLQDGGMLLLTLSMDVSTRQPRSFVLRLLPDGSLDPAFNGTGMMEPEASTEFRPYRLLPQENGMLLISGRFYTGTLDQGFIARFDESGNLDRTFGNDGYFTDLGDRLFTLIYKLLPDGNGNIVFTGQRGSGALNERTSVVIGKIDTQGGFSPDFNEGQAVVIAPSDADAGENAELTHESAFIDSSGRIVLGGRDMSFPSKVTAYLARLLGNGQADSSVGSDGVLHYPSDQIIAVKSLTESTDAQAYYYTLTLQPDTTGQVSRLLA
jgi:uncharacterized delta-60 repeat protein